VLTRHTPVSGSATLTSTATRIDRWLLSVPTQRAAGSCLRYASRNPCRTRTLCLICTSRSEYGTCGHVHHLAVELHDGPDLHRCEEGDVVQGPKHGSAPSVQVSTSPRQFEGASHNESAEQFSMNVLRLRMCDLHDITHDRKQSQST